MPDHNHDERWDRGWRKLEQMARRWGNNIDGFGGNFRIGRMLASGDLRLVALYLIEQQPRHGYDLIKAVEDKSQGFYSPSPGIVYPALTFLEEAGYVTSAADGNRKLYTITDEGRQHLADNREAIHSTLDFLGKAGAKMNEFREMGRDGWPFSGEQEGSGPQDGPGRSEGWPFGDERGDPRHRGGHRHHGRGPDGRGFGPGPGRGPRPDRDMADVIPEVNEARRELKAALATAVKLRPEDQQAIADILRRAAGEIRQAGRNPEDDVDL
jgi:DNA-binding PadR family transcriptional regulator